MKFSLIAVLASASLSSVSSQTFAEMPWKVAMWCCLDSNEKCSDACDWIKDCNNQQQYNMAYPGYCEAMTLADMGAEAVAGTGPTGIYTTIAEAPAVCRANSPFRCCDADDGYVCGDPHFKTWGGLEFDYQGECDLLFVSAPRYARGLGLDIHIRTEIKFDYSFIAGAAIKIGDSVLEVGGWGEYILNGVESADLGDGMADNIPVEYEMKSKKTHVFTIDVGQVSEHGDAKLKIQTYKEWVSIHVEYPQHDDYDESYGMMGSFPKGERLARDGKTVIEDDNVFGQEWQILPEEATIFQGARFPQSPSQCILPKSATSEVSRRLSANAISEEQAVAACAHLDAHQAFCVHDVLATQDLEMADAGAY